MSSMSSTSTSSVTATAPDTQEIKAQLWSAATRLQRAQSKFDHQSQPIRKEIATLLSKELALRTSLEHDEPKDIPHHPTPQSNPNSNPNFNAQDGQRSAARTQRMQTETEQEKVLSVARLKAEKLMQDDGASDLMSILERYCDILLEGRLTDTSSSLDTDCLESICGIIAASPIIDSQELATLSQSLGQKYPDLLAEYVLRERVSPKLASHLSRSRPTQIQIDTTLISIAKSEGNGLTWTAPYLLPEQRIEELNRIVAVPPPGAIDPSTFLPTNAKRLQFLLAAGIPTTPSSSSPSSLLATSTTGSGSILGSLENTDGTGKATGPALPYLPNIRLRAWQFQLGLLPNNKSLWSERISRSRKDYTTLSEQVLSRLASQPLPQQSQSQAQSQTSRQDKTLIQFSRDIESLPLSIREAVVNALYAGLSKRILRHKDLDGPNNVVSDRLRLLRHEKNARATNIDAAHSSSSNRLSREPSVPSITLDNPPISPTTPATPYMFDTTSPINGGNGGGGNTSRSSTILLSEGTPSTDPIIEEQATELMEEVLLRMLYVHSTLHSAHALSMGPSPSLAAMFAVMLYVALEANISTMSKRRPKKQGSLSSKVQSLTKVEDSERSDKSDTGKSTSDSKTEDDPLGNIEADVFWMVEALVGNTREIVEGGEEAGTGAADAWTARFSAIVRWADSDLWNDLTKKGLDPALPYYSYRWIPTLFTHVLPLEQLLSIWDAILSLPPTSQALFCYAMGTAMLIRARVAVFETTTAASKTASKSNSLGVNGGLTSFLKRQTRGNSMEIVLPRSPSSYSPIASPKTPLSPTLAAASSLVTGNTNGGSGTLTPGGMSNAFLLAVKILQDYDCDKFGGIDRVLDAAWSIWRRWNREGGEELLQRLLPPVETLVSAPNPAKVSASGASPTNKQVSNASGAGGTGSVVSGFARLKDLAWKGITNDLDDAESRTPSSPEDKGFEKVQLAAQAPAPKLTISSPVSEGPAPGLLSSFGWGAGNSANPNSNSNTNINAMNSTPTSTNSGPATGLGTRLKDSVWKGITNQLDSPDVSPEASPSPSPSGSPILVAHDEKVPEFVDRVDRLSVGTGDLRRRDLSPASTVSGASTITPQELEAQDTANPTSTSSSWLGYATKLKDSDTAAALLKTGTNLRVKALDAWTRPTAQSAGWFGGVMGGGDKPGEDRAHQQVQQTSSAPPATYSWRESEITAKDSETPPNSSFGSWKEMFAKRGSLPAFSSGNEQAGGAKRTDSFFSERNYHSGRGTISVDLTSPSQDSPGVGWNRASPTAAASRTTSNKRDSNNSNSNSNSDYYSPPPRPSFRDSIIGAVGAIGSVGQSPQSPPSDSSKNPLQAALSALSGTSTPPPAKRGPKPLLLNSSSLMTPSGTRPGSHSRTPSRGPSPSPTPTPRPGDRFSMSSTDAHEDRVAPGATGVVSLRRGPLTNPRTAGYGVGVVQPASRQSSRASSFTAASPSTDSRRLTVESITNLGSPDEPVGANVVRQQRSMSNKGGFLIDHGGDARQDLPQDHEPQSAISPETSPPYNAAFKPRSPSNLHYATTSSGEEGIADQAPTRSKRSHKPPPVVTTTSNSMTTLVPELMVITPRATETKVTSDDSPLATATTQPEDLEESPYDGLIESVDANTGNELTVTGATASVGAHLNRSRTPHSKVRRQGSAEKRSPRSKRRDTNDGNGNVHGNGGAGRKSMIGASGSEEEGARADVEDLDDLYGMY